MLRAPMKRPHLQLASAFFAALVAIMHAPILVGKTWLEQDHVIFNLPMRWYLSLSLRAGRIPAWASQVDLGAPFAANPNSGFFYLPAWVVALLPWPFAADLLQLVHLIWGALGVAVLSSRLGAGGIGALLAGTAFATGGAANSLLVHGVTGYSLAWMPWVVLAAHRLATASEGPGRVRAVIVLAGTVAAQILSGDPACVITTAWLALGIALIASTTRTRTLSYFTSAYGAAGLLAACLLIPLAAVSGESERAAGVGWAIGSMWSLHPLRLIEAVWPDFLGAPRGGASLASYVAHAGDVRSGPNWITTVTIGLPVVVLAAFAKGPRTGARRGHVMVLGALIVLALGAYTPVYAVYRFLFPPERMIRYPERHFLAVAVMLPVLAGIGFTRVFGNATPTRAVPKIAAAGGLIVILSVLVFLFIDPIAQIVIARSGGNAPTAAVHAGVMAAAQGGLGTGAITVMLALLAAKSPRSRWMAPAALAVVALFGMLNQGGLLNKIDRDVLKRTPRTLAPAIAASLKAPLPERLHSADRPVFSSADKDSNAVLWSEHGRGNMATVHGLAVYPGLSVLSAPGPHDLWEAIAPTNERAILDLLGVRYFIGNAARTPAPGFVLRTSNPSGLGLYENLQARPRAFVTSNIDGWSHIPVGDDWKTVGVLNRTRIRMVESPGFTGGSVGEPAAAPFFAPCSISSDRPEIVQIDCASPQGGYAVLLDAPGKGWTVTVDGAAADLQVADGLFRAVAVSPGRHLLRFEYKMPGLWAGLIVSAVAFVLLALLWLRFRDPRNQASA